MKFPRQHFILILASAVLLWLGFRYDALWFLTTAALVPLLLVLSRPEVRPRQAFWYGLLFGTVFLGFVMGPQLQTLPLTWLGIYDIRLSVALVLVMWSLWTGISALFVGLWALCFKRFRTGHWPDLLLAPSLWVVFEYARAWGISLAFAGPGYLLGPHWTMGFVGYSLSASPLVVSWASLGGVYLLSFIVVFFNTFFFRLFTDQKMGWKRKVVLAVGVILVFVGLSASLYGINQLIFKSTQTIKIAVLHTNFPAVFTVSSEEGERRLVIQKQLVEQAAKSSEQPDIIILPEDARFLQKLRARSEDNLLAEWFGGREAVLVDSGRTATPDGRALSKFHYYNTADGTAQESDKLLLAPYGEYLPWLITVPGRLVDQGRWIDGYAKYRQYSRGTSGSVAEFRGIKIGAGFCSELVSPSLYRDLARAGAGLLINASSHSAFHGSANLFHQYQQIARTYAASFQRPFVLAGNTIPSFVVSANGTSPAQSSWDSADIQYAVVPLPEQTTFSTAMGDWVIGLCLSFVTWEAVRRFLATA